jgi:hypothetical protein
MKNAKYKMLFFFLLAIGALLPVTAIAAEASIDFNIRFFDRRIYYVADNPINIQITITNNSPNTYRFKLADERVFSLDFDVRTVSNRTLEPADTLIRKRTQYQQIFFREIAVESGESFSFIEDLRNYVNIKEPGSFVVQARVYPELLRTGFAVPAVEMLESKRLSLSVRPPLIPGPDGIPLDMNEATGAVLVRERLAPDQVVDYMINARQRSQWEKFFLYLDLEEMLIQDAAQRRRWNNESEEGRRRMVSLFRQELQNSTTDGTISVIPSDYEILRTEYNNFNGTVTVLQKFRNINFTELKRYTYQLRFKDNVWMIVDYSVTNLGTE